MRFGGAYMFFGDEDKEKHTHTPVWQMAKGLENVTFDSNLKEG